MLSREIGVRSGIEIRWNTDRDAVMRGAIAAVRDQGINYLFFVSNDSDTVQREALSGHFYERDELDSIQHYFAGGTFVDIGANVGNHAIFAAKALGASRVICFEPNPEALRILNINIRLNTCEDKVCVYPIGLSDKPGLATIDGAYRNNLGSVRLKISTSNEGFTIGVGDELLVDECVGFIKIDTEGYELAVLEGLRNTIKRDNPVIFVEVDESNLLQFQQYVADIGYRVVSESSNYKDNTNFMILKD